MIRPLAFALCALGLLSCERNDRPRVVLYTSADTYVVDAVVREFELRTGIKVDTVGDTEATKTTGLVQRLINERGRTRADVWWSSEALGTVTLVERGLLSPFTPTDLPDDWPEELKDPGALWYGFAQRARVIAYDTRAAKLDEVPTTLQDLTSDRFRGLVGIARPQFGTTRSHIAAVIALKGEDAAREWLRALKANDIKLYDGNSAVVTAIAQGEIRFGLTDSDDVRAAQRNGWPVACITESPSDGLSAGAIVIPNTVAILQGAPNRQSAERLASFLLSADVERLLAKSDSGNTPVRTSVAKEFPELAFSRVAPVTPMQIAEAMEAADRLIAEVLPPR